MHDFFKMPKRQAYTYCDASGKPIEGALDLMSIEVKNDIHVPCIVEFVPELGKHILLEVEPNEHIRYQQSPGFALKESCAEHKGISSKSSVRIVERNGRHIYLTPLDCQQEYTVVSACTIAVKKDEFDLSLKMTGLEDFSFNVPFHLAELTGTTLHQKVNDYWAYSIAYQRFCDKPHASVVLEYTIPK